jgi:hypothetical protein
VRRLVSCHAYANSIDGCEVVEKASNACGGAIPSICLDRTLQEHTELDDNPALQVLRKNVLGMCGMCHIEHAINSKCIITDEIFRIYLSKLNATRLKGLHGYADMPRNTVSKSADS